MKNLVVIPARGGSKSIPRKNITEFNGMPLLAHTIKYAESSLGVDKIIVSTDDNEIAQIAKEYNAEVPFIRPKELSKDTSSDYGFMRHALDFFDGQSLFYDNIILLRPTSPLRPKKLIEKSLKILELNIEATSVRCVAEVKEHPYRVWRMGADGSIEGLINEIDEPYNLPRQLLPKMYFQTGDIEVVRRSTLLDGSVCGKKIYPIVIDKESVVDIDTYADLEAAKKVVK